MIPTWPGLVLLFLLGTLSGAVTAFFRARSLHDVATLIGLGILGWSAGQALQLVWTIPGLQVGTVNVGWGLVGAGFCLGWWVTRHPVAAR